MYFCYFLYLTASECCYIEHIEYFLSYPADVGWEDVINLYSRFSQRAHC